MIPKVLVIDDEIEVGNFFEFYLQEEKKYQSVIANSGQEALRIIENGVFDLALVDLKLPDINGIELLKVIKQQIPHCEVIIMTGYSTVKTAVEAMKLGAFDYIEKPFGELSELDLIIDRALTSARPGNAKTVDPADKEAAEAGIIMGNNSPLKQILKVARKIANQNITVLIDGETGTGKEILARYIHNQSKRAPNPFICVNCGALTETLLESELFGHEKGAFTGAHEQRRGIFEIADKGTLFLDEIGEAPPSIQVKLLRVLETREFFRVGGEKPIKVDVRIIAATNTDLAQAVSENKFREDLFYRLDVISLNLPPLRERLGDIPALTLHFLHRHLAPEDKDKVCLSAEAQQLMLAYDWPGNIRELSNVIASVVALQEPGIINADSLPEKIITSPGNKSTRQDLDQILMAGNLESAMDRITEQLFEALSTQQNLELQQIIGFMRKVEKKLARKLIKQVLFKTKGDRQEAARLLDITPRMLRYYLNERGN